jgi:hypothetical protein
MPNKINVDGIGNIQVVEVNDVVEDEFLKRFNLIINTKYNILICKTCRYVIEKQSAYNHASRNHRIVLDPTFLNKAEERLFIQTLERLYPEINSNVEIESEETVQGLNITDGYQCKDCNYMCCTKRIILKHMRTEHGEEKKFNFENCKLQSVFLHPDKKKFFKVKENPELIIQDIAATEENDTIFGIKKSLSEPGNSLVDHRFVSLFQKEAELDLITDKFNDEELKEIVLLATDNSMVDAVDRVFNMGEKSSGGSDNYINEYIENPLSK